MLSEADVGHGDRSAGREQPRRRVEFEAFAERSDGTEAILTIWNLSYEGCELRSNVNFHAGERLKLNLPRVRQIVAEIRWSAGGKAGAKFIGVQDSSL